MESNVTINTTIGLNELVKSAAHQRIAFLQAQLAEAKNASYSATSAANRAESDVSGMLFDCAPPHVSAMASAALDAMGAIGVAFWWEASDPDNDTFRILIESERREHQRPGHTGIRSCIEFDIKRWDVPAEVQTKMDEAVALLRAAEEAKAEVDRIESMLNDRDFRQKLEGEILTRYIDRAAPDTAALLCSISQDMETPRLIGVKS